MIQYIVKGVVPQSISKKTLAKFTLHTRKRFQSDFVLLCVTYGNQV